MPHVPDPANPGLSHATLAVDKESLGFAAAHFSVLEGGSESLHGHNYRVALRATGRIRTDGTVIDFAALKSALRAACTELDHRMLVPTESASVQVEVRDGEVELRESSRRFVFPRSDVCLLPVSNTTCECLAAHLLRRVRDSLQDADVRLEVTIEETPGQGATVAEDGPAEGR
jgi:6-pyruvoyltetrahydropterin/6-carboxytetrahydropterin synthase